MSALIPTWIPKDDILRVVRTALNEDIGTGDITSTLTVPTGIIISALMVSRSAGYLSGLPIVHEVYSQMHSGIVVHDMCCDGDRLEPGTIICTIEGDARTILTGERVALNFLQRLSAVTTLTRAFVERTVGTSAKIVDTRKTTPGLRAVEKYAVRCGGGHNHRFGLYDAVLIKDNHIAACGSINNAVTCARNNAPHTMTITVECDTMAQVHDAITAGADVILLDNMTPDELKRAVDLIGGRAVSEASGGITLETVQEIALTGVDIISVGALTHSAGSLDIGLDIEIKQ